MNTKPLNILYEDTHILVCVKSHGIATQSRKLGSPDMVSLLKNHIAHSNHSKGEPYLAVIHRLDQPVSGILVFAKTPFAAKELNRQLTSHSFGKYYRALVDKMPPAESGTLENYMVKDRKTNISQICTPDTPGAKLARLHYETVQKGQGIFHLGRSFFQNYMVKDRKTNISQICTPDTPGAKLARLHYETVQKGQGIFHLGRSFFHLNTSPIELNIHLDTGRHHQIRVQLAALGCPILGDSKYNPQPVENGTWQTTCLCAYRLDFHHPKTQKPLHFELEQDDC